MQFVCNYLQIYIIIYLIIYRAGGCSGLWCRWLPPWCQLWRCLPGAGVLVVAAIGGVVLGGGWWCPRGGWRPRGG